MKENKKHISNTVQTGINMAASFMTYGVSMLISFFLSPYIVRNIGVDANGFITLANNFIGYVSLITIALNTLSGRFVTVNIYQNKNDKANQYYSSVFFANAFLSVIITVIGAVLIIFLDKFLDISKELLPDVRVLFTILFINSIIGTVGSVFSIATFATNKLYLSSLVGIITNLIRAGILVLSFYFFPPKTYYVALAGFFATIISLACNIGFTKKLTPQLKLNIKDFDIKKIFELVKGGIWATINRLGAIFANDLDLLITNMFINSVEMGVLSLSKTIPNAINGVVGTIVGVFSPNYTILYAQGKAQELVKNIKTTMKIMSVIVNIPVIVLIVWGREFYKLWQPTQDADRLQLLSILAIIYIVISGSINCIYNIFTITNKLKLNALAVVFTGFLNVLVVFILLKTTDLGIYAIAGVNSILAIIRNITFTVPYGAKCLDLKWYTFYPEVIRPIAFVTITSLIFIIIKKSIIIETWIGLIIVSVVTVIASFLFGYFIILNKTDKKAFNDAIFKIKKRINKNYV